MDGEGFLLSNWLLRFLGFRFFFFVEIFSLKASSGTQFTKTMLVPSGFDSFLFGRIMWRTM